MNKIDLLTNRLNDIARSLENTPEGLGLLGLGSAGQEHTRMDEYSDLDFFAIVSEGHKHRFIDNLHWLSDIYPIAWSFRNTADGYKLMFADGVFCEFAVFEPQELANIPYSPGRFVYRDPCLPESLANPQVPAPQQSNDEGFLLGELITNLYVGMCRYRRGEKVSAMRFIQVYAVDRLITLLDLYQARQDGDYNDPFCLDRRVEFRHPQHEELLMEACKGADACPQSAATLLDYVKQHYSIDPFMEEEIRKLL